MGLLGIPQERIAQRLGIPGITERFVQTHLPRFSELKNGVNDLLKRGFGVNTIAEKLGADKAGAGGGETSDSWRKAWLHWCYYAKRIWAY